MTSSIFPPLLCSGIETAWRRPYVVLGSSAWNKRRGNQLKGIWLLILRVVIIVGYLAIPAIIINAREEAKVKRAKLLQEGEKQFRDDNGLIDKEILRKLGKVNEYLNETRKGLLTFKRNELAIESPIQLVLQIVMLLLGFSNSVTHSSLQTVFHNVNQTRSEGVSTAEVLLIFSVIWSFKTCGATYVKIKQDGKANKLTAKSKVVLALRGVLVFATRIICCVAFFTPFLGLGDVLAHWTAEKISLNSNLFERLSSSNDSFWDKATLSSLYRSEYESGSLPVPPSYTSYTLLSLKYAFTAFLGIFLMNSLLILAFKTKMCPTFKAAKWTSKVQHILEVLNLPDCFADFEEDNKDNPNPSKDFKKHYQLVLREITLLTILQGIINILLLCPVWITGLECGKWHVNTKKI